MCGSAEKNERKLWVLEMNNKWRCAREVVEREIIFT